ncbi:MAG: hypothetical protein V9E98_00550 [Candidatus Nanopelagicales bacterium]
MAIGVVEMGKYSRGSISTLMLAVALLAGLAVGPPAHADYPDISTFIPAAPSTYIPAQRDADDIRYLDHPRHGCVLRRDRRSLHHPGELLRCALLGLGAGGGVIPSGDAVRT